MTRDPGLAVLAAWGAAILTGIRMVRNGESTEEIEKSARYALDFATKAGGKQSG